MSEELRRSLRQAVIEGNAEAAHTAVAQLLTAGMSPLDIVEGVLSPAMNEVGRLYEEGEYFIPDLVMAGEAMKMAMAVLEPALMAQRQALTSPGVVVIGTVEGDIHEIGKSLVGVMLGAAGFTVHDLGVDVPAAAFVEKVGEVNADVVGLSALLTTTMRNQQAVIAALTAAGLREHVRVIVGGAPASAEWARRIGADGYAENATEAVRVVRQWLTVP